MNRSYIRSVIRNPPMLVWSIFVLLNPVYVIGSGLPQPSDWLVLILAPLALATWNGKLDRSTAGTVKWLLLFTLWVCAVNYSWALVSGKASFKDFVFHPLFYIFNAAVFLSAVVIARRDPALFMRVTVDIVYVTVAASLVMALVSPAQYRTQAFFNSPNQLGYYSLLSACLFSLTHRPLQIPRMRVSAGIAACAYLAFVSASRASLAGILMLLLVLFMSDPKVIIIGVIASVGIVSLGGPIAHTLEFNEKRVTQDRGETFAEERGYDRIWKFPRYLLLGAGEGDYDRFANPGRHGRELHSSFGSLLFGYGLVGVGVFLAFAVRAVRGAGRRRFMMLVPALVYTVAHQGLRFTMFWVVIAAFVVLKKLPENPGARVPAST